MSRGKEPIVVLTFAAVLAIGSCSQPNLTAINDGCVCPGSTLRLNCTAVGGGLTVWSGSAFPGQCHELVLSHNQFTESRFCSDMSIIANPLSIIDTCFTSQLTVNNVNTDLNGMNIICQHDFMGAETIGNYTIMLTTDPFLPPDDVSLTDISSNGLTFSWSNVAPNCRSITYNVAALGCGNCPNSTTSTLVTCSGVQLNGNTQACNISVQAITCDNLVGDFSETFTTILQATNEPVVTILPTYSQNSSYLVSFTAAIDQLAPVFISGNDVAVLSYTIEYRTSSRMCGSATVNSTNQACQGGVCRGEVNVATSSCTISADSALTVNVVATSVLGMGPAATSRIDSSIRNFVQVTSNVENSTLTCNFTNELDRSRKSCNVTYGRCGQQPSQSAQGGVSSEETNIVRVQLDLSDTATYCYAVRARNGTYTVFVEGNLTTTGSPPGASQSGLGAGAVVGIVIVIILVAALVVTAVIVMVIFVPRARQSKRKVDNEEELDTKPAAGNSEESPDEHRRPSPNNTKGEAKKQIDEESSLPATVPASTPLSDEQMKQLQEKHPGQVPVAIERYKNEEKLEEVNKKFWIPEGWTVSKLERKIKKLLELSSEQPLYLTVNNKMVVEGTLTLKELHSTSRHSADNHLHIAYSSKEI